MAKNEFKISAVRYNDTNKSISRYFSEVTKEKILDPEEEARLAVLAKKGDLDARDKIIKSNLRFGISVAKFYANPNSPLEDLISEANKGMLEAMETFDPTTGFKFISYAVWHIRKNILSFIGSHSRTVRIPMNVSRDMKNYHKAEDYFIMQNGREPTIEETLDVMEKIGMNKLTNSSIDAIKNKPVSVQLDPMINSAEENTGKLIGVISSEEKTDSIINKEDLKKITKSLFVNLTPIEERVVTLRYGLENGIELSNSQISEFYDLTPERIRQILMKALKKIKITIRKNKIDNILGE